MTPLPVHRLRPVWLTHYLVVVVFPFLFLFLLAQHTFWILSCALVVLLCPLGLLCRELLGAGGKHAAPGHRLKELLDLWGAPGEVV